MHPPTYPSTHLPITNLCTHPPIHPPTYPPTYPPIHTPIYPSTHPPTHPSTHLPTHLPTHPPIYPPTHPPTHPSTHPLTHLPTYPPTHRDFSISYLSTDDQGTDVYLSLLSDWDFDAAIDSSSHPYLCLKVDLRPFDPGWLVGCLDKFLVG